MPTRNAAVLAATLLLGLAAPARDSSAGATVDLLFVGQNGSPIAATDNVTASPGDTLTMAVLLRNDEALTAAVFSLHYDLDGDDELDVVSAYQWSGIALAAKGTYFAPFVDLKEKTSTVVGSFQGITNHFQPPATLPPSGGAFAGGYQMGTVTWKVKAGVDTDGADISGFLVKGIDGFGDAAIKFFDDRVLFRSASVNLVPEPGTAALLGLGLLGLVLTSRRRPV